jgi:hypothetical protein
MVNSQKIPPETGGATASPLFAICTLVTDILEYDKCLESFRKRGFDDGNSQFLYIDNSAGNRFDAYAGIIEFVRRASARYVIVCHQDVVLIDDGFAALRAKLEALEQMDPHWALAGNSGLRGLTRMAMRISDPWIENGRIGKLPMRVDSLDENFLVIKTSTLLAPSADIGGFHFYGVDLCIQARLRGYTAYVVDFHLRHNSAGKRSNAFYDARRALERKYAVLAAGRIVRTPCDIVFLGWCAHLRFLRWPLVKAIRFLGKLRLIATV